MTAGSRFYKGEKIIFAIGTRIFHKFFLPDRLGSCDIQKTRTFGQEFEN